MIKNYIEIKRNILLIVLTCFSSFGCSQERQNSYQWLESYDPQSAIENRITPPAGFQRVFVENGSFENWLRRMPLYPLNTAVKDYRGLIKVTTADSSLAAVINYDIRNKKLEQCMDIILRWYAEFRYCSAGENDLQFPMPGGSTLKWSQWAAGYRPLYRGVDIEMRNTEQPDSSRQSFEKYLWEVFYYSYTQTAYHSFQKVTPADLSIGDFLVKKGQKGHAVLIMDMAVDSSGNKVVLVGHGDTPARNFFLLNYKKGNPWFPVDTQQTQLPLPIRKKMTWDGLRRFE